ncbi:MAG: ABC transporter ATP-binding protein [Mitsuokella jalaludinii]|nr:ABC transporter ATP-binding protein [Mitsuokella jalaludinii]
MIEFKDVCMRFDDKEALKHISLTIRDGETLAVIGGSGSGKSTFLRLLIGLIKPTSGQILIDGQNIVPMSEAELNKVRLKMGMVFQYSALFDSMTVGENVAFGLREHTKLSDADIKEIVREKLHLVGLDGVENMMPNELSGGMKKRVSLARAIAVEPSIICYDEPSSGLDPLMTEKIDELIINTQKALSVTSIVVTHDMASACCISDRIAMIYEGELIAIDTVERFKKIQDARVQAFFRTLRTVKTEKEDTI